MDQSDSNSSSAAINQKVNKPEDNSGSSKILCNSDKLSRVYKKLQTDAILGLDNLKMLDKHSREARNKTTTKKTYTETVRSMFRYDERGVLIRAQRDLCDCLVENCPGCHFPCTNCKSTKCGPECRCNRRFVYEQVEIEGTPIVLQTPMKSKGAVGGHQYYH